jgi:hypothetical protein
LPLACDAIRAAHADATLGAEARMGALFTNHLKRLAGDAGVDLGLGRQQSTRPRAISGRPLGEGLEDAGDAEPICAGGEEAASEPTSMVIPGFGDGADLWEEVCAVLQVSLPRFTYDTWVRNSQLAGYRNSDGRECLTVGVPNQMAADWLANRLLGSVQRAVGSVLGRDLDIIFQACTWRGRSPLHDRALA